MRWLRESRELGITSDCVTTQPCKCRPDVTYWRYGHLRDGWFQVTVIAPCGNSRIRRGFVSELAAQRWVDKSQKNEARREYIASVTKVP